MLKKFYALFATLIIAGYGYRPTLASMERCIDSAVAGCIL